MVKVFIEKENKKLNAKAVDIESLMKKLSINREEVIVVKNSEMGLNSRRSNIELDDFSGRDNDYQATFQIEVDKEIKAGTKKLAVEVYRDGNLEDAEEVTLTVPSCGDQAATGDSTADIEKLIEQAKKELQESLDAQKEEVLVTSKAPLRESSTYLALLSVLTVLLLIAVLLGLVILLVRRSPKNK